MTERSRVERRLLAVAVVAAAFLTTGAEPVPAPGEATSRGAATAAAMAKAMPTPRLYHVQTSGTLSRGINDVDMCVGVGPFTNMLAALSENPAALAALSKGCTQTREKKDDGSFRMEMVCSKAAGAFATSRQSLYGTLNDMHQRMEMVMDLEPGEPVTSVSETHMTFAGDCPPGLKPGQFRKANGDIVDPLADLAKLAAGAKAK